MRISYGNKTFFFNDHFSTLCTLGVVSVQPCPLKSHYEADDVIVLGDDDVDNETDDDDVVIAPIPAPIITNQNAFRTCWRKGELFEQDYNSLQVKNGGKFAMLEQLLKQFNDCGMVCCLSILVHKIK